MKKYILILFLFYSISASAATYYVSSSGNDSSNGISESTPWKSIGKVNSMFSLFKAGDRILFRRGDTFYGQLRITKSGVSGNPITVGAYGTGNKPVITGFTTLSSWKNEGNGIYSKNVTCESSPEMVTVNEIQYGMGRWPNTKWNTVASCTGDNSITCGELNSSVINWTGAELVQRKPDFYTIDRNKITNHTGQTLHYSGSRYPPRPGYGYFIQNDIRTLDSFGEWYYRTSTSTFYMYFGSGNPDSYTVKLSTVKDLITFSSNVANILIDNISLIGANQNAFNMSSNNYITIQNCDINFSGHNGIRGYVVRNLTAINNNIKNSNDLGIFLNGWYCHNALIKGNIISNAGLIMGSGASLNNSGNGVSVIASNNSIIENNEIYDVGYNGVSFAGSNLIVRNNFINRFCLRKEDGAGIYYGGAGAYNNLTITNNIVLNGLGAPGGKPLTAPSMAAGIYIDYEANNGTTINNNIVAHCAWVGIFIHSSSNIQINNNTVFDCKDIVRLQETAGVGPIRGITLKENILVAKSKEQLVMKLNSSANDFNQFGVFNNNYYARPIDDNLTFDVLINWGVIGRRSLEFWQSTYSHDLNSKKSPVTINNNSDIEFYYNETLTNKVITLKQPMIDVRGDKYVNSVTLLPFTSIILMVDPDPAEPLVPLYESSVIQNATPSILEMSYHVNLASVTPSAAAFTVMVNGASRTVTSVAVSGSKVLLTLSSPIAYGDVVTVGYTQASINQLQTPSGGLAVNIAAKPVTNNLLNPAVPNEPPVVIINNQTSANSGFVYEIDASGSYDPDDDILTYEWTLPPNVPVSSTSGPKIKYLAPVLIRSETVEFQLSVTDGRETIKKNVPVTIEPYKPELSLLKFSNHEGSNYYLNNLPFYAIDGNPVTKWSVEGDNQWLLLYLEKPSTISHLQISFLPEQKYESYFDIYVSRDNRIWEPVFTKVASCGFSGAPQVFDFPADKKSIEYSFIKLIGRGNALNNWNNFSEFRLFGNAGERETNPHGYTDNISIYPNPARDHIQVLILEPPVEESQFIRFIDLSGKICQENELYPSVNNIYIPFNLKEGIYIVQVILGSYITYAQRLVVIL